MKTVFSFLFMGGLLCSSLLNTSCNPKTKGKDNVLTISGDLSHKNKFKVFSSVWLNETSTFAELIDLFSSIAHNAMDIGCYLCNENDKPVRIKYIFPLMGDFENILEDNEGYWQTDSAPPSARRCHDPYDCTKGSPLAADGWSILNKRQEDYPSFYQSGDLVYIPLFMENGRLIYKGRDFDLNKAQKMLKGAKVCFLFICENGEERLLPYWARLKQAALLSQGRFSFQSEYAPRECEPVS